MEFPIKFPSEDDVIREDVARFRALSHAERFRSIRGMLSSGLKMMRLSPKAEFLAEYSREQENLASEAVREVNKKYGNRT